MGGPFQRCWSAPRSAKAAGRSSLLDPATSPEFPLVPPFLQLFFNANHLGVISPFPRSRPPMTAPSHPAGGVPSGGSVELGDHSAGRLYGPPGLFGSDRTGRLGRRGGGPAVQPLGVAAVSDHRVTEGMEPLEIGSRLQLASDDLLAEVVPFWEE